jgi:hypothetical protein
MIPYITLAFPPPIPKPEFLVHRLLQPTLLNSVAVSIPSHPQPHLPPVRNIHGDGTSPVLSTILTYFGMASGKFKNIKS